MSATEKLGASVGSLADVNKDGKIDAEDLQLVGEVAKDRAQEVYAKAQEMGYFSHFWEYNEEILKPLKYAKEHAQDESVLATITTEVIATIRLQPTNPRQGFVLCNVLALMIGILETLVMTVLGHGMVSLIWNGGMGYIIAYTLYWTMTCTGKKPLMFYSLIFIVLYILFNLYMMMETAVYVLPAALYGTKAFVDAIQLINGFQLYKEIAGDKLML